MASETPGSTVSLVGQGSFLTKPSLHMVGCTGKKSTFTTPPDGLCPLCKAKGQSQILKTYRINFTQSILLCSDPQCIYPLGSTPLDNLITNTLDLKNPSPSSQKKRNISELSPIPQRDVKRSKTDPPLLVQFSPIDAATSQAESSKSLQVVPPSEHDATTSGISQCVWTENQVDSIQNVPEASGSILNTGPSSPWPPTGSHYNVPDSLKIFSAGEDRLCGEPMHSSSVKTTGPLDAGNKSSDRLSENEGIEEIEDKELRKPELKPLNLVSENGITLNGSQGMLENNELSPDYVQFSKHKALPTELQQNQLGSQMNDKSPQEVSDTVSAERVIPVSGCLGEKESAQPCDFILNTQKDLCESRKLPLLQCTDNMQHGTDAPLDNSCAAGYEHRDLSTSHDLSESSQSPSFECTVLPVPEQDTKSHQLMKKSSLKSISPPDVEASSEENINHNPVEALSPESAKSLHLKQDSCEMTSTSYSLHDIQQTCLSKNDSMHVCKTPCTVASVNSDCSIGELIAEPLKDCHFSASLQLVDAEEMHIEIGLASTLVEDIQPEVPSEVNSSFNLPGISCKTDADVDYRISPEEATSPEGCFSNQVDKGSCEQSSETATPSALAQDSQSGFQPQKSLPDVPLTPCTALSVPIDKSSPSVVPADLLTPYAPLPEQLDLIYDSQKSVRATPSDSIQVTRDVHKDCSLIEVCTTVCPLSEKDSSTEQEISPLPENLLFEMKTSKNSVEPCGMNSPPQNIQAAFTNKDNSIFDVTGSSCDRTSAMDDGDAKSPAPLSDNQIENNDNNTPTPCLQGEGEVEKEASPLLGTVTTVEDDGSGNQASSSLSDSPESKKATKKTSFENTVLPDLLLDIQLEHRMEEQLSAVPSPTCDADLMVTNSADYKQPEEGNTLQVRLEKLCVQEAETSKMEITRLDVSDDVHQNSINLSDSLSSEGNVNNESIESGSFNASVINTELDQSEEIPEARTYDNSQRFLQWRNRKSLCWLDCILSSLVLSRTLAVFVAKHGSNKESIIHNLFAKYNEATVLCQRILKKNRYGKPIEAEGRLNKVRMHIFDKLKPLLKCELGDKESPVFAFPLLLRQDPDFQKLYVHSFTWNFKCESCGYASQDRCENTMTTCTQIAQDWKPLNAVHRSPCNKCQAADQRREMHLETLQCMFMLHFVEGLPSSDLKAYAFQFGEHWYEIGTVVRYRDKHFSTWMANDDDTWLESDDLKGSFCRRHHKFRMRAEDIHIVIWERRNKKDIQEESSLLSSPMCVSEIQSENKTSVTIPELSSSDLSCPEPEVCEPAYKQYLPQDTLSSGSFPSDPSTEHPPQLSPVIATKHPAVPVVVPKSKSMTNNISNALAGMEGYADDDIITLTLVEIPCDSEANPVNVEPSNPGVIQVEASSDVFLQPAPVEMQSDSEKLPQLSNPKQSADSPAELQKSGTSPVPVYTIQQIPVQLFHQKKQTTNMPAVTSTPNPKPFTSKKSIVDNLMGTLVKSDNFFLNSSINRKTTVSKQWQPATLLKESDSNGITKKAENFDGYRAKTVNVTNSGGSNLLLSKLLNNSSSFNAPKEKAAPPVKSFLVPAALDHMKPGKNGLSYGKMLAKDGGLSNQDKVRKLRMKLLKKLKAKKNELAMIEKVTKLQQNSSGDGESQGVLSDGVNRRDHLRGFLQELQDHIDNADNESIGTVSSCASICSSPGDAEFFAELFSPSPVDNSENGSKFLEMLADGYGISADHSQRAAGFDCPTNNTTIQSTSGADSLPNTFNQSSSAEDSLNILSSSTLAMMNEDTAYLDSFVDIF